MGRVGVLPAHFLANAPLLEKYTLPFHIVGVLSNPNQQGDSGYIEGHTKLPRIQDYYRTIHFYGLSNVFFRKHPLLPTFY